MSIQTLRENLEGLFPVEAEAVAHRPLTREIILPLATSADSATTLAPAATASWSPQYDGEIIGANVVHGTTLTGHTQNSVTFSVSRYASDGTVSTTPLALALSAATVTVSAFDGKAMTLTSSLRQYSAGDVLVAWANKVGTGISTAPCTITLTVKDR